MSRESIDIITTHVHLAEETHPENSRAMKSISTLFYRIAKQILPSTLRMRLKKYRGAGLLTRFYLGRQPNPTVLSGPFVGLKYPAYGIGSEYFPKLLGTYELELHPALRQLSKIPFKQIVIVGAGEGYYAGGMAKLFPTASLTCYEADMDGRIAIAEMATANQFGDRLKNRDFCKPTDLRDAILPGKLPLIVMDVEGGERDLLDLDAVPALIDSHILVEVHDCYEPDLSELLQDRFKLTHHCLVVHSVLRTLKDAQNLPLPDKVKRSILPLMDEGRPAAMCWFILTPF